MGPPAMSAHDEIPKLPFNDFKHIPTRPEIDVLLGMLPSIELRHFEEHLALLEPRVDWSMHWYDNEQGWGYRGSYKERVFCILHFFKGYFTVTIPFPDAALESASALRELTDDHRVQMRKGKPSARATWVTLRVWKRLQTVSANALVERKLVALREGWNKRNEKGEKRKEKGAGGMGEKTRG